jgi:hypothetical protein
MGKTVFSDGNKGTGTLGTRVMAAFLNSIFNHRHDGLNQDGSAPINYAVATGSANAYVVALTPAMTAHIPGMQILFKANFSNTGAATININGLGAVSIRLPDGSALSASTILNGQLVEVAYDGANYQLINRSYIADDDSAYMAKTDISIANDNLLTVDVTLTIMGDPDPSNYTSGKVWDLSGAIPAGVRFAIIFTEIYQGGPNSTDATEIWMRPNGSSGLGQIVAINAAAGGSDAVASGQQIIMPIGANRKLDYKCITTPQATSIKYHLQGWIV